MKKDPKDELIKLKQDSLTDMDTEMAFEQGVESSLSDPGSAQQGQVLPGQSAETFGERAGID